MSRQEKDINNPKVLFPGRLATYNPRTTQTGKLQENLKCGLVVYLLSSKWYWLIYACTKRNFGGIPQESWLFFILFWYMCIEGYICTGHQLQSKLSLLLQVSHGSSRSLLKYLESTWKWTHPKDVSILPDRHHPIINLGVRGREYSSCV